MAGRRKTAGLSAALRGLDDRVLGPAPRRYDEPVPLWMSFGGLVGSVAGTVGALVALHVHGSARVVGLVLLGAALVGYLSAVRRWTRAHRRDA